MPPTDEGKPASVPTAFVPKKSNTIARQDKADVAAEFRIEPRISEYYSNPSIKPAAFCKSVRRTKIGIFDQDDVSRAVERIDVEDPTLARTVALLGKGPEPIDRWMTEATIVSLERYIPGVSSEQYLSGRVLLDRIVRILTEHFFDRDKIRRARAQNMLRLVLVWMMNHRNLDPKDALLSVRKIKKRNVSTRGTALRRDAIRLLTRARANLLVDLSLIASLFDDAIDAAARERQEAIARVSELRAQIAALESRFETIIRDLDRAQSDRTRLLRELQNTQKELSDQKELRVHDRTKRNGQFRGFLINRLQPPLSDARDALNFTPPHLRAAEQRIEMIATAIREELEKDSE